MFSTLRAAYLADPGIAVEDLAALMYPSTTVEVKWEEGNQHYVELLGDRDSVFAPVLRDANGSTLAVPVDCAALLAAVSLLSPQSRTAVAQLTELAMRDPFAASVAARSATDRERRRLTRVVAAVELIARRVAWLDERRITYAWRPLDDLAVGATIPSLPVVAPSSLAGLGLDDQFEAFALLVNSVVLPSSVDAKTKGLSTVFPDVFTFGDFTLKTDDGRVLPIPFHLDGRDETIADVRLYGSDPWAWVCNGKNREDRFKLATYLPFARLQGWKPPAGVAAATGPDASQVELLVWAFENAASASVPEVVDLVGHMVKHTKLFALRMCSKGAQARLSEAMRQALDR